MMNEILIRTDGNVTLGLGHVVRCLSLASMLKGNFIVSFYIKNDNEALGRIITENGFDLKVIPNEKTFINEVNERVIVVLDGYHFDTDYQQQIKSTGAILVCIDDLHDKHFIADVIINHAPCVTKDLYQAESYTRFLLGPEYALLRSSFQQQAAFPRKIDKIDSVLICFGGSDSHNLTGSTLKTLLVYPHLKDIIVVTGSAYRYSRELLEIISQDKRVQHHHNIGEKEIIRDLLDVELAIVPASGILLEVLACRTPAISGYYVDNQLSIYHGFLKRGVFYDAGNFEVGRLRGALELAFCHDPNEMIKNQVASLDGKSASRYIDIFKKLGS